MKIDQYCGHCAHFAKKEKIQITSIRFRPTMLCTANPMSAL